MDIPLGRVWRNLINGEDRTKALMAFEWATLSALRLTLRNSSVYVGHSFSFRSLSTLLIPETEWEARHNDFYDQLQLPQDATSFLTPFIEHIDQGLGELREAAKRGEVWIDTAVHLSPLKAEGKDVHLGTIRRAIFARDPSGQLPET